jgi:hypothetical protein
MNNFFHPSVAQSIFLESLIHLRTGVDTAVAASTFLLNDILQGHGGALILDKNPADILPDHGTGVDTIAARQASTVSGDPVRFHQAGIIIHAIGQQAKAGNRAPCFIQKKM